MTYTSTVHKSSQIMRRIVLPILSLFAVACSSEIDEVTLEEVRLEKVISKEITDKTPTSESRTFTIPEHTAKYTSLGIVNFSNAGLDQVTYSIACEADLTINEKTGELKTGPTLILDYETAKNIEFTISAFDGKTSIDQDFTLIIEDIDETALLTAEQKELIAYFQYLTLWKAPNLTPIDVNRKWECAMKLYLDGQISDTYRATVERVVSQYNALTKDGDFTITLVEIADEANANLFFGTREEVEEVWPDMYGIIKGGNYSGYAMTPSQNDVLMSTRIWISNPIESLFKHELGHALGFGHSNKCDEGNSFLCSKIGADNEILPIEEDVIRYLYHKDFPAGLSETEMEQILANLIVNEELRLE